MAFLEVEISPTSIAEAVLDRANLSDEELFEEASEYIESFANTLVYTIDIGPTGLSEGSLKYLMGIANRLGRDFVQLIHDEMAHDPKSG